MQAAAGGRRGTGGIARDDTWRAAAFCRCGTGCALRRADLGLPAGDDAPLANDPKTGAPVDAGAMPLHLRKAQLTRTSIEANAGICRGMLQHRYNNTQGQGETARVD